MHKYQFETLSLHAGAVVDETNSRALPMHRTTAYVFRDTKHAADLFALKELGNIYSRLTEPTTAALEQRMATLEGGKAAVAVSSGTAAIHYAIVNVAKMGDEIVASKNLYGGTYTMFDAILPDYGITTNFVDINNFDEVRSAINNKTRAIYTEVIGNPTLDVANIKGVSKIAKEFNLPLIVDATFNTPYHFRPIEHGADVVVHSLSKWIGGHGTAIGGIVIDAGNFDWSDVKFSLYNEPDASYHGLRYAYDLGDLNNVAFAMRLRLVPLRNLGSCMSPDNAWIFMQGLETLSLRMRRHSENALQVAKWLQTQEEVSWVRYPGLKADAGYRNAKNQLERGFGGMVVFGIKGGVDSGSRFIDALNLISHVANVGDAKSLAIHPASTTHSQLSAEQQLASGVGEDLIRLSIGIEHINDIINDIEQALVRSKA